MPKSSKPSGGRPNFEPRYGEKKTSLPGPQAPARRGAPRGAAPAKAGSRSAGHRGHRPAEQDAAPKGRWTAQERAGRDEARGIRTRTPRARATVLPVRTMTARLARTAIARRARTMTVRRVRTTTVRLVRTTVRPVRAVTARRVRTSDRPARSTDDRPARSYDDRPARSYDDRPARPSSDRPARSYERPSGVARTTTVRRVRTTTVRLARTTTVRRVRRDASRPLVRRPSGAFVRRPPGAFVRATVPVAIARTATAAANRAAGRSDWNARPDRTAAQEQHVDVVHERLQAEAIQAENVSEVTFGALGLGDNIVRTLATSARRRRSRSRRRRSRRSSRARTCSRAAAPARARPSPSAPRSSRACCAAQAGQRREFGRAPKALILAPTRELALQIDRTIQPIARSVGLFTTQIYGGVPQGRQVGALKKGVDIIIGTPGSHRGPHRAAQARPA